MASETKDAIIQTETPMTPVTPHTHAAVNRLRAYSTSTSVNGSSIGRARSVSDASSTIADSVSSGYPCAPVSTPINPYTTPVDAEAVEDTLNRRADIRIGAPNLVPDNTPAATEYAQSNYGDHVSGIGGIDARLASMRDIGSGEDGIGSELSLMDDVAQDLPGVPEMNTWTESAEQDFKMGIARLAQAAVDGNKEDPSASVEEIYSKLVGALLAAGPVKFDPAHLQEYRGQE